MPRLAPLAITGITAVALTVTAIPPVQAAPLPALNANQVGGGKTSVDQVGWRRGYGYRRGGGIGGALVAGAALGRIGTAIAASARPRYRSYGYGYPAYGGYYGGYGGGYGGYGYRPVYGYPAYGGYYGGYGGGYGYPYAW